MLIAGSVSNSSVPCDPPPDRPADRAAILDLPITGAFAALAACGMGRGGVFTFVTDFDLAAGRALGLALLDFGRGLERAATFFLELPLAFVGTDRFLFI